MFLYLVPKTLGLAESKAVIDLLQSDYQAKLAGSGYGQGLVMCTNRPVEELDINFLGLVPWD